MRMRAPLAAATLTCAAAAAVLSSGGRAAAASVAPVAQAWWNVANTGGGAPAPPGVAAKDLFVGGSKGDQSLPNPASGGPSAPSPFSDVGDKGAATGIAAVRYVVPAGEAVDRLVLKFDGSPQSSISLAACRITGGDFKAELDGPWSDLPPYDCSVPSIGSLTPDGTAVQFTDIGGLASGSVISVVIVPEYAAYSALLPPGPDSLLLRPAPPAYSAASSGSTGRTSSGGAGSASGGAPPATGTSLSAAPSSATAGTAGYVPPPSVSHPAGGAATPAPVPATGSQPPPTTGPVTARVPAVRTTVAVPDDGRARIASAAGLAAVLGAFAWMIAGDVPRLRRALAARLAGPGVTLPEAAALRGVGRFRRERSGRPPDV